jgi:hypothetical protein
MWIRDPEWKNLYRGSGMEKSRIQDKHPGSAILVSGVSDAGVPGVAGVPALVWLPTMLLASLLLLVYALVPTFLQLLTLLSLTILLLLSSKFLCSHNETDIQY